MQKILQSILPFELPQSFSDEATCQLYRKWDEPTRQIQISAITFLTALLYIIFTFLDKSWASEQAQILMLRIHLFAVVPILLTISYLAYKKRFYDIVMPALMLFPIPAYNGPAGPHNNIARLKRAAESPGKYWEGESNRESEACS